MTLVDAYREGTLAYLTTVAVPSTPMVLIPVGSLEQHGPHLPLDTDTRIAEAVASEIEGTLVAPPICYGSSGEHEGFTGTVSVGHAALTALLVEVGRSIFRWSGRVVFVNGHGGNARALVDAVTLLRYEGRDAAWFACAVPGADAHAGRTETSLLLHLAPDAVRLSAAEPGNTEPVETLMPRLRDEGMRGVAPNGVLGDPTGASADEGCDLLAGMRRSFRSAMTSWTPDEHGRLR